MPTFRTIGKRALQVIGVLGEGDDMTATQGEIALFHGQNMIDAWAVDRLTLAVQTRTVFTLTSGSSTAMLGPSGADVTMVRPVYIDAVNYIVPGTSPVVESPIAIMNSDQYDALSIKALSSALPTQCFYQTSLTTVLGTLTFWPVVSQNVQIVIYTPTAIGVPVDLDSVLIGPSGYQDALLYQLALRLITPFAVDISDLPLLPEQAKQAFNAIKRVNVMPGLLGMDPALALRGGAGSYNVLTDR